MMPKAKVVLIPWDPDSGAHRKALVKQREECSWHQERVEKEWREAQAKGEKCIYWIKNPLLRDTAQSINAIPRKPSHKAFVPVGHISLDAQNPEAKHIDLKSALTGAFWIKSFYVSRAIQSQGVGRAAMDEVEKMATRAPLNGQTLILDTIQRDDALREEFAIATTGSIPKVPNQDWYARRGYHVIQTVQNYYKITDRNGRFWDTKTVFMRKDIS
ncbi:hypothetical protein N7466_003127 [Penicillium verhagenii]|uniref:uncharacterized protein n=1 Tax=Penicillium verhagenii TaxID=1562060 RepID=UPI002545AE83|nr:uncharacterized protein N7466_003127 [Penicillium verhagenii]KAJ5936677.1 hypothetical protein N7466_003127 [Penicillium verhagenii]